MQQLNFLDPKTYAELEFQRQMQEEEASRQVLKKAPVSVKKPSSLSSEEIRAQIAEKQGLLEVFYQGIKEIADYHHHKSIFDDLERKAQVLSADYQEKLNEADRIECMLGESPKSLVAEALTLKKLARDAEIVACAYRDEHIKFTPALGNLERYQEQARVIEAELAELHTLEPRNTGVSDKPLPEKWNINEIPLYPILHPAGPVQEGQDVDAWKKWSLKSLDCPCGDVLKPTSPTTWRCDDYSSKTCSRSAHAHMNAICVYQPFSGGHDEWLIPGEGLVDESRVIPADDFEHRSFLCACGGVLHPIQKQKKDGYQWRCDKNPEHGARKSARRIELLASGSCSLTPIDFDKDNTDRPWEQYKGKTLKCPCCPGDLISKSHDKWPCHHEWLCNQDSTHRAWTHYNMIAVVRGPADVVYCVPVIPADETHMVKEQVI